MLRILLSIFSVILLAPLLCLASLPLWTPTSLLFLDTTGSAATTRWLTGRKAVYSSSDKSWIPPPSQALLRMTHQLVLSPKYLCCPAPSPPSHPSLLLLLLLSTPLILLLRPSPSSMPLRSGLLRACVVPVSSRFSCPIVHLVDLPRVLCPTLNRLTSAPSLKSTMTSWMSSVRRRLQVFRLTGLTT